MSYFFDSSAIVKRYHPKPGADWVWTVCKSRARSILYRSALAEVEVIAALWKAARLEGKHPAWAETHGNEFLRHLEREYKPIAIDSRTLRLARTLAAVHSGAPILRSLDAVQLACALSVRRSDPQVVFVTADARLATIAQREGLTTVDAAHP